MKLMDYQYKSSLADFDFEVLNSEIEAYCARDEFLLSRLFSIQLIVEELVTNILKYGVPTAANNMVEIKIHREESRVILDIADNTAAFNPLQIGEPDTSLSVEERQIGGLGLYLVRQKTASLHYEYRNGMNLVSAVIE